MSAFSLATLTAYLGVLALGLALRNRFFLVFIGIILGIHSLSSVALYSLLAPYGLPVAIALWYAQGVTFLYFMRLTSARASNIAYRALVSWPASFFSAGVFLGLPWAIGVALGFQPPAAYAPFAIAAFGFMQSSSTKRDHIRIVLDRSDAGSLKRLPKSAQRRALRRRAKDASNLTIAQITDPHLGPFMSVARLAGICARAVREAPDLIVLTGDFLTVESQHSPEPLTRALAPLRALQGRVFACFGNHDHECPELVREALEKNGVVLLVDDAASIELPSGRVQLIGADHRFRAREVALEALAQRFPREAGSLRLWLLHDPGAFFAIPEGEADLVLSGHTHGGHLGLLSLGLPHTIVSAATKMPDHGLWARGRDRLYVHRGTGHYGFPLRVGVPAEESVLEIVRPS